RRRSFRTRSGTRVGDLPWTWADGGGDRNCFVAGAAPFAAQRDGVQTRYRRPEDDPRPGGDDPIAGAVAVVADPDGRRYARGVLESLERLEGDVAARAVRTGRRSTRGWPVHHRARRASATREAGRGLATGGMVRSG